LIRILASDEQRRELLSTQPDEAAICWVANLNDLIAEPAEAYLDLQFQPSAGRMTSLQKCLPATVVIHAVADTLKSLELPFIRVNAWPGFLERQVLEYTIASAGNRDSMERVCSILKRECVLLPDEPGFISARILSMIINEAYFALEAAVSTKREIDLAMRTGTNYPYGPFEWSNKIGICNIAALLQALAVTDARYQPCSLLLKEAALPTN
jgi:3-hydroxybutyryl-CoA dehydrogenase